MQTLNILCKCGKGKLQADSHIDDYYTITCEVCDIEYDVHYTGFDCMLEESEYNDQLNDDIIVLNKNGSWHGYNYKASDDDLNKELENFNKIHFIDDGYEEYSYYQKGATFKMVVYNPVHKTNTLFNYVANKDGMENLMNHFFKKEVA